MEFVILYLLINIGIGALACFAGKRLFYIALGALVFLGVLNIGLSTNDGSAVSIVIAVVLGIVAALLSKYVYKAGVFIAGALAGAALGFLIGMLMPQQAGDYLGVVMAVVALPCGLAALRWCDLFVRLGTSYAGATFIGSNLMAAVLAFGQLVEHAVPGDMTATFDALSAYIGGDFTAEFGTAVLVATVVFTIAGLVVQGLSRD